MKTPQLGRVIVQDDVEIGANTTIDRGATRDTIIGEGSKIDNLVQIGHNVVIGRFCAIVAQTGIAGSCEIGDFVALGGQSAIAGHLKIGEGAAIAAKVRRHARRSARRALWRRPARPLRRYLRGEALLDRLARRDKPTKRYKTRPSRSLSAWSLPGRSLICVFGPASASAERCPGARRRPTIRGGSHVETEAGATLESADILEIMRLLPHRYPFLLVDRIIDIRGDESCVGVKNVTINEPQFQGHFPERPVMPGVLLIEAMAQTAGVIVMRNAGADRAAASWSIS